MNLDQFEQLVSRGYNRIPLVCEVLADLETPLSVYLKLANKPYSYLFESVQGGENGEDTPLLVCRRIRFSRFMGKQLSSSGMARRFPGKRFLILLSMSKIFRINSMWQR